MVITMTEEELRLQIKSGEDSTHQFKADIHNPESLAAEMVALANANGGTIYLGVDDDGKIIGLTFDDVIRLNNMISNVASQLVRSPLIVQTENVPVANERIVICLHIPEGIDKPYFDKNGVIWFKSGSDKRRINSKEELRRIFQMSKQFFADEIETNATVEDIDKHTLENFLRQAYATTYPENNSDLERLLKNMHLVGNNGNLNFACVLMFAKHPQWILPQFGFKAMYCFGNDLATSQYLDSEDFDGSLQLIYKQALAFIMRNIRKRQKGSVNEPGVPEIPPGVFEELLVNAIVHRDYFINAPIRLLVFDNRIEIISPGHLPNNLTVANILTGNTNIRNPILVSYVAKGLLPYKGLGSGILRAKNLYPEIDFIDDRKSDIFKAVIHRHHSP